MTKSAKEAEQSLMEASQRKALQERQQKQADDRKLQKEQLKKKKQEKKLRKFDQMAGDDDESEAEAKTPAPAGTVEFNETDETRGWKTKRGAAQTKNKVISKFRRSSKH